MGMTIDNSCEPKSMSKEEIVDTLKTMVFGVQAFERFNAKEREALDYAISSLETDEAYQLMYEGEEVYTKDEVIASFNRKVEENIKNDGVVVSIGYSTLQPEDEQVHDVFERADHMMYERKKELKSMGAKTRES